MNSTEEVLDRSLSRLEAILRSRELSELSNDELLMILVAAGEALRCLDDLIAMLTQSFDDERTGGMKSESETHRRVQPDVA